MCLMLCARPDWQYAELPSSASDAVLCSVLVRKMWSANQIYIKKNIDQIHVIQTEENGIYDNILIKYDV